MISTQLKFHKPGLAPIADASGAYHVRECGAPAYDHRYRRTFGFYDNLAAMCDSDGWFHIDPEGVPLYQERYAWCGNFQEEKCPVRTSNGDYFHIDLQGRPLYSSRYRYVGDFRDGVAVVCREDGKGTHIDAEGNFLHSRWYFQLDVFHKGYARARDEGGWFHITIDGHPAYSERYADLEPFYNGQAHAQTLSADLVVIDEEGKMVHSIATGQQNLMGALSGDLVGFWKSETIKCAVDLKIPDHLPGSLDELALRSGLPKQNLRRFLRALWEIDLVKPDSDRWRLTEKGQLLKSSMAAAVQMWWEVQGEWKALPNLLATEEIRHHPTFKERCTDPQKRALYRQALEGYARADFGPVAKWPLWESHQSLTAFGQTGALLLEAILQEHPLLKEEQPADALLLPRYLHYFPDQEAVTLLKDVSLVYIFELVLQESSPMGSLLDLNMLAESGGKLRTESEWRALLDAADLKIASIQKLQPHLHLIIGERK